MLFGGIGARLSRLERVLHQFATHPQPPVGSWPWFVAEEPEDDMHLTRPWMRRVSFEPRSLGEFGDKTGTPGESAVGGRALGIDQAPAWGRVRR